ncbi:MULTISPECIES: TonB-dependent receptor [unclassified Sphingomonas]|uniref:TonB-dependent receptor n=1 Tax=unclassified Sphingomonas TaxID=196159 RepID=UPI00082E7820|nr:MULTISPECIES: TonB-dependent receptor [unclassified Sphingomonas]
MRTLQLFSASALALIAATPAIAQDTSAPAAQEEEASGNEVVITATRRNETVQDVPIAVTAVPATLLANAGVEDVRGLEQLAPSLQSSTGQSSATGTTLYIRGITTAGDNPGFEPAVGVFIDGVFRARAGVAISELPQLERVEVLRGPQGTLFGRNTSAGALSIFTAQPAFELGGYLEGSYGNYNAFELKGAVTGPVTEQLALRLDGGYRKRDGYIEDVNADRAFNNVDRWYARGQALYDTSTFSLRLIADYYETDEQCCGAISVVRGAFAPLIEGIAGAQGRDGLYEGTSRTVNGVPTTIDPQQRRMAASPNRDLSERVRDWGFSGEINADLTDDIKLTSITAYRDWRVRRNQDVDFSGIDRAYREGYRNELSDFTQELRFQGSAFGGVLDWLVGGFYLNETNKVHDTVRVGNDGNRYVDSIFNALAGPSFGGSVQFYGSLGTAPTPGAVFLNPAVPNVFAAYQAAYGASLAPVVGCFRTAVGAAPSGVVPVATCNALGYSATPVPGLAALAASPLPGVSAGQGNTNDYRVKTNAFALFTHNIINISDKLSLTLGARWNYEKKDLTATISNNTGSCTFFNQVRAGNTAAVQYANLLRQLGLFNNLYLLSCNPAINTEFNGSYAHDKDESKITGTAKLAYKVNSDILVYGGYDRGYKSGGYNMDQATFDSVLLGGNGPQASDLAFGSESVDAYEIGVKTQWGRAFTLNIAAFYQKFSDLQSLVFSGNNFVVQNVDSTTSKGVEVESIIQPVRNLTFRMGYSYINAKYDADNNFVGTPLQGQEGRQVSNQPEHTVTIATTWTPQITSGIRGLVHVDMRYNSEVNIPSNNPNATTGRTALFNPGYALLGARVGLQTDDGKKSLEFFVENLTNQYYHITGFAVPEQTGNYAAYPGLPRFFGVKAKVGF